MRLVYWTWFLAGAMALGIAAPAAAQVEVSAGGFSDSVVLTTPRRSGEDTILLLGANVRYRSAPWSFSAEYAGGGGPYVQSSLSSDFELERERVELALGYEVFDSLDLIAGARHENISLQNIQFFFILPITVTEMDLEMVNLFAGAQYETDPQRRIGLRASGRVFRGKAELSTRADSGSEDCEGLRVELAVPLRLGTGSRDLTVTVGVAHETFEASDAGIEIESKPQVFVQIGYRP